MDSPNWDDLRAFRAVAEELNFTRAATRLHVTPPTLSQRIRRLERRLQVRLFNRTTRRVELTLAGQVLLTGVAQLSADWQHTQRGLRQLRRATTQVTPLGLLDLGPAPVLAHLTAARPDREWRPVLAGNPNDAVTDLRSGRTAALVAYVHPHGPWPDTGGLARATVVREPLMVALPRGHRLGDAAAVRLQDLAHEAWIGRPEHDITHSVECVCRSAGFVPRFAHVTSDFDKTRYLVGEAQGITLSSPCWRTTDRIIRRSLTDPPYAEVRLLWNPHRTPAGSAESLLVPLRGWYAALAKSRNPDWWTYLSTRTGEFPGVAQARGQDTAPGARPGDGSSAGACVDSPRP